MRLKTITLALGAALLGAGGAASQPKDLRIVAPGVVEPRGQEREIASEVIGRIVRILVEENQKIVANEVIALINPAELQANLEAARANLDLRRAELDRLVNGARPEERREAEEVVKQNEADRDFLRLEFERQKPLAQSGYSAQARLDQVRGQLAAADARLQAARERLLVVEAPARPDEVAAARARIAAAEAAVGIAQAQLDKTSIRSPIDGEVLRLERRAGEVVTNLPPTLIAVVGDISRLMVRAEVDQLDVSRVAVGQRVVVTSDSYGDAKFPGRVTQVASRMGKKQVFTGRSAERLDNRSLQVLIELDPGARLPIGLTVDVFIETVGN